MKMDPQSIVARLLLTLFVFVLFVPILPAQKVEDDDAIDKEQAEVRAFVDSFLHDLDESKDIDQMSKNYFVSDFRTRFAKDELFGDIDTELFERLNDEERYKLNRHVFNVSYLALMHTFGQASFLNGSDGSDGSDDSDDSDIFSVDNMFTPQTVGLIRNSKTLKAMIPREDDEEDEDFSFEDIEQLREFMIELRDLSYAQKISINDWSIEQKSQYDKNMEAQRESAFWYKNEVCEDDCDGFPENTRIIEVRGYPLYFDIVNENGALRIYNLFISPQD